MAGAGTTTKVGGLGGSGGGGDLLSTNNLSDVASAATSRTNLGFSALADYVTLTGTQTLTNKTLTTPTIADIRGTNAKSVLKLNDGGSNVNYWDVFASNTGAGITIRAGGSDTNITANFYGKGTGSTILGIATGATAEVYGVQVGLYSTSGTLLLTSAGIAGLTTTTATTNAVVNVEQRVLSTSGTAATGLGLSKTSYIEVSGGSSSLAATESVYLTDGTSGAANVLWTLDAGSSNINAFEILGSSGIKMGGSTSGYVTIKPSATAGDWTLTLPANAGTSGYSLTTDGSGNTSWTNVSGGGGSSLRVGTMARLIVETCGGQPKQSVALTSSRFIALAGYTNVTYYTGSAWSNVAHGMAASSALGLCANGDKVIVCGTGTTWRKSSDAGDTWSTITHGLTAATYAVMARGGNNGASTVWVVGHTNSASLGGISTDNGDTWSNKTIFSTQTCVCLLNDGGTGAGTEWLALTSSTATRKSTDNASTWAAGSALGGTPTWGVYAASKFWAVTTGGVISYCASVSGAWTSLTAPIGNASTRAFGYADSKFCFLDSAGLFWTCADPSSSNVWAVEGFCTVSSSAVCYVLYFSGKYYIVSGDQSTYIQVNTL